MSSMPTNVVIVICGIVVGFVTMLLIKLWLMVFKYVYDLDFVEWWKNKRKERKSKERVK